MTEETKAAKPKAKKATKKAAPAKAAEAPVETPEDENRRRFREALERKQGQAAVTRTGHGPDRAGLPASNDKRRQQFRRKSGGG